MNRFLQVTLALLIGLFIFGLGVGAGYGISLYLEDLHRPDAETMENFDLFWEVWGIVENKFYEGDPDDLTTTYGAIRGALASLDDPYTVFVEPQPRALEKARLDGQFGGIGAYVMRGEAGEVILDPMVESPAEKAGILKDDQLIAVDGTALTPEMTTDEVVLLIRGEVGTPVDLTVTRADEAEPLTITVERAIIETPSVEWRTLEEDPTVGYIRILLFSNRTAKELDRAIEALRQQGATRYIVDLRGNGGGLLDAAVDTVSKFVSDGVVVNEDRRGEPPKVYKVRGQDQQLLDEPMVVLVDGGSASASEIVAGALQDYNRAPLIGEKTYGKGSVQLVYDLSDQSSLHVTVAKWFTPEGNSIDGVGLIPDIEVLFSEDDHQNGTDPQFLRALEEIKNR